MRVRAAERSSSTGYESGTYSTRSPRFAEEARRQSRLVSEAPEYRDDMDFLERASEFDEAGDGDAAG